MTHRSNATVTRTKVCRSRRSKSKQKRYHQNNSQINEKSTATSMIESKKEPFSANAVSISKLNSSYKERNTIIVKRIHPQDSRSFDSKKKRRINGYCKCSRLCLICGIISMILIGAVIAAALMTLLRNTNTTTTTTTTTTSVTETTSTTETTTMTYAPTGIYALKIPPCATWDPNGITVAGNANGSTGRDSRSLDTPVTIFIDNNYTLYVCDRDNHRIMKYLSNQTNGIVVAGLTKSPGSNSTQLKSPKGVAVDQMGAIIVADSNNYRIQRFPLGSIEGITIGQNTSTTLLGQARDLRIDVNNVVYITDSGYSRIVKFLPGNTVGIVVAGSAGVGSSADKFREPFGTFVNESKILYVADMSNHRIQQWMADAPNGTTVAGITGVNGSSLSQLSAPQAVTLDNNGYIYIADSGNHRIVRWTQDFAAGGRCIVGCTGTIGIGATQLNIPRDLKFDASGNLYVSDQGNNRIQKFLIQNASNCTIS